MRVLGGTLERPEQEAEIYQLAGAALAATLPGATRAYPPQPVAPLGFGQCTLDDYRHELVVEVKMARIGEYPELPRTALAVLVPRTRQLAHLGFEW